MIFLEVVRESGHKIDSRKYKWRKTRPQDWPDQEALVWLYAGRLGRLHDLRTHGLLCYPLLYQRSAGQYCCPGSSAGNLEYLGRRQRPHDGRSDGQDVRQEAAQER